MSRERSAYGVMGLEKACLGATCLEKATGATRLGSKIGVTDLEHEACLGADANTNRMQASSLMSDYTMA